tara:strand:+ start:907 stop:1518 length:612 start_codon:yes stop_codon:yes gene_type:complete
MSKQFIFNELSKFAYSLSGKFCNKEQASLHPSQFAHINIYYIPLHWDALGGPWMYSEQSYNYDKWMPYRQGLHLLKSNKEIIKMLNFDLRNKIRLAGAGFTNELLKEISYNQLVKREGCSMEFKKIKDNHYLGETQSDKKCLIKYGSQVTILRSKVELDGSKYECIDEGFHCKTGKKIWGSENGIFKFKKIENISENIINTWE